MTTFRRVAHEFLVAGGYASLLLVLLSGATAFNTGIVLGWWIVAGPAG